MDWTGEGVVIGLRPHGESSVVLEAMTADRGRHLGLVKGGRGPRLHSALQVGNTVRLSWRARLEDHLGHYAVEPLKSRAGHTIDSRLATFGTQTLAGLLRYLPERDPHHELYAGVLVVLDHLEDTTVAATLMARFEIRLLEELGFGLDLSVCAATGSRDDLAYVSPKTGRAVGRSAGLAYHDRMLALPEFLRADGSGGAPTVDDLAAAFRLTGHFLVRHVSEPRGQVLPTARDAFIRTVLG